MKVEEVSLLLSQGMDGWTYPQKKGVGSSGKHWLSSLNDLTEGHSTYKQDKKI